MTSKTWSAGTVIDSAWLQDTDNAVYKAANSISGASTRTALSKFSDIRSVKDFGAVGDGTTDDTTAIQNAINSFSNGAFGYLVFPTANYKITGSITNNNRSLVFEGCGSTITITSNATQAISLTGTACEVRNLSINRSGATVTSAIRMTGLQHVIRNVTSRNQVWPIFILAQDLKESHFSELRVDNDTSGKTGIIFQFDYSVNNTISDSMLGYCSQAFYGSSTAQPTSGYFNEGLLINNVITAYCGKVINYDNGTFIAVNNCIFDFCETQGIFVSNGGHINISNSWIASNTTNGFIGVGSLAPVSFVSVIGNTFVRGASAISGTVGVSLSGPSALVIGNSFTDGMNGGTVTQATSQVIGNTISGGGTNISSSSTVASIGGSLAINNNTGLYPSALAGSASIGANGAPPAQVAGYAIVNLAGTNYKVPYYNV
jgi:hypothetical protein